MRENICNVTLAKDTYCIDKNGKMWIYAWVTSVKIIACIICVPLFIFLYKLYTYELIRDTCIRNRWDGIIQMNGRSFFRTVLSASFRLDAELFRWGFCETLPSILIVLTVIAITFVIFSGPFDTDTTTEVLIENERGDIVRQTAHIDISKGAVIGILGLYICVVQLYRSMYSIMYHVRFHSEELRKAFRIAELPIVNPGMECCGFRCNLPYITGSTIDPVTPTNYAENLEHDTDYENGSSPTDVTESTIDSDNPPSYAEHVEHNIGYEDGSSPINVTEPIFNPVGLPSYASTQEINAIEPPSYASNQEINAIEPHSYTEHFERTVTDNGGFMYNRLILYTPISE